jgi:hypothetical protein
VNTDLSPYYREAARLVYDQRNSLRGACWAISEASPPHGLSSINCTACDVQSHGGRILKQIFASDSNKHYWLGRLTDENRHRRTYCLLLAAECWKDWLNDYE